MPGARSAILIRSQLMPLLFGWLTAHGRESVARDIWQRFELALPTADSLLKEITVSLDVYRAAYEMAAELCEDENLGLHIARDSPRGVFGVVEFVARNAPTVGDGARLAVKSLAVLSDTLRMEVMANAREFAVAHFMPGEPQCVGRHANELTLGLLLRYTRELAGVDLSPVRMEFGHAGPADSGEAEAFFGTRDIRYRQTRNLLVFDAAVEHLPIKASDPVLLPWLAKQVESMMPARGDGQPVPGLREHIGRSLEAESAPTLSELARRLHMSSRTLQRRLKEADTTFQAELDCVRRERVEVYVRDREMSVVAISQRLGYGDLRGFERAFFKWFGMTPTEYRRRLGAR
jgi:AraC-like DNA-binding protein